MEKTLIYVHDPMCSWCWGFEPVRKKLFDALDTSISIKRFVGGLAPDSSEPMPAQMQTMLKNTWQKIEQSIPGTTFNYNFWTQCQPRRSTYPSNRAVIAARLQSECFDTLMTYRIQQAYYSEAKNPSNDSVLIELAREIGLDVEKFTHDLNAKNVETLLEKELMYTRQLGLNSFPSVAFKVKNNVYSITLDYNNSKNMLAQINQIEAIAH